jgi:hypothetical protein
MNAVAEFISEVEQAGIELIPLSSDRLRVQGPIPDIQHYLPEIIAQKYGILAYLAESTVPTAADIVRIAERILADACGSTRTRRKGGGK